MAAPPDRVDNGSLTLRDGRRLRWERWGIPEGDPVLFFHGNPGSRLFRLDREALKRHGVPLLTVDRPGIGGSDPKPGRRMRDWPADVEELVEALDLESFGIVAFSMGGPHALAVGAALPDKVRAIAVHATPGPWTEEGFEELAPPQIDEVRKAFETDPTAAEENYRQKWAEQREMMVSAPGEAIRFLISQQLGDPDLHVLDDRTMFDMVVEDGTEAVRQGVEGFFEERMAGYVLDWGFHSSEVQVPVSVFHGTDDRWVPVAIGRELADRLPDGRMREVEGLGHFPARWLHDELVGAVTTGG